MNDSGHTRRISVRGSEGRTSQAPLKSSFRKVGKSTLSLSDTAKVLRATDIARSKAETHHAKHREKWTANRYTRLLSKSSPTVTLSLSGMNDPKATLMARARNEVAQKHAQRLARIDKACDSMLKGGGFRVNRKMAWGKGLGE